jgi:hypothetical protein
MTLLSAHNLGTPQRPRHPIHTTVLGLLSRMGQADAISLGVALAGCSTFRGRGPASATRAYRIVAQDVLTTMSDQGFLVRDEAGRYRLAEKPKPS